MFYTKIKRQAKNGEQIIFQGTSEDYNNVSDFQSSLKVASLKTYFQACIGHAIFSQEISRFLQELVDWSNEVSPC